MTRAKRAKGGKGLEAIPEHRFYNAEDSKVHEEADDEKPDFKRGGKAKKKPARKRGGKAEGQRPQRRADKPRRARGGGSGGHSPFTKAATVEGRPGGDYDGKPSTREDD
jgi:hypothetical protein